MARHYSRFSNLEEKRNIKKAVRFLFLTGLSIVLLFFFGLPLVIKFAAFMTDIRKSSTPIEKTDTTPPAPPQLKNIPEATNKSSYTLNGTSEAGSTVLIFLNEDKTELVVNEDGVFTTKLSLVDGENEVFAQAKDAQGNESQKTQVFKIVFDDTSPELQIQSPTDGASFSGPKNQRIEILGTTDPEAGLIINERFVSVDDEGNFTFSISLSEGDNVFNLKAEDKAGNTTEKSLTLKYSP